MKHIGYLFVAVKYPPYQWWCEPDPGKCETTRDRFAYPWRGFVLAKSCVYLNFDPSLFVKTSASF